ncbi:hypothetical protein HYW99_01970, partial [Candidatus Woesearchaeota archaeon]|nr:hypothetical protein [Candidatus Woesearchaeota archaeon]
MGYKAKTRKSYLSNITKPNITESFTIDLIIKTFLNNSQFFDFVVGDTAPAEDVIAASDLFSSWRYINCNGSINSTCEIKLDPIQLASQIIDPNNTNIVSIGRPHNNALTNIFLPLSLWPLDQNTALISSFVHNGTATLIVAGNTDIDTRIASRVMENFSKYNLSGQCFEVNTSNQNNLTLHDCNMPKYPKKEGKIKNSNFDMNIISPQNNSVIGEDSILLSLFTNKYTACNYSLDSSIFTELQESEETIIT